MISSMKQSHFEEEDVGTSTEHGIADAKGIFSSSSTNAGSSMSSGLRSDVGSQSLIIAISFAKSVTISENVHQAGGLADPPNVILKAMNATPANTTID